MHFVIREAGSVDVTQLTLLSCQLGYVIDDEQTKTNLQHILEKKDGKVFVATLDQQVIGWTHIAARVSLESGMFYELMGLVVDEQFRGQGAGTQLAKYAVEWAMAQGAARIRVRSNIKRTDAHRFYERLGFTLIKEQKVFSLAIK
jgi:GNAT superfamily N-acetyltransferase